MELPLPWQKAQWASLCRRQRDGVLPHALLFRGPAGLGKRALAWHFAHYLLCLQPAEDQPCGECAGCKLYAAGNHPDIFHLLPDAEKGKKGVSVDQVRELIEWQGIMAHRGGNKLVLVDNANLLNRHGANALLKTLEEPSNRTFIMLISENPGALLATIRSRCQAISFPIPAADVAVEYIKNHGVKDDTSGILLNLAAGAPLSALALADGDELDRRREFFADIKAMADGGKEPVGVARSWEKQDRLTLCRWLDSWCRDLIRLKIQGQMSLIHNSDMAAELAPMAARAGATGLFDLQDRITASLRSVDHPLNAQLQLESILMRWHGVFSRAG